MTSTNIVERDAVWNEGNLLSLTISRVIEAMQLQFYYDILRRFPTQPIQVWQECEGSTPVEVKTDSTSSPVVQSIENDGIYDVLPIITITPSCCICPLQGPITISDGENTLTYNGDVCGKLTFYPNGVVMEDEKYDRSEHLSGDWPVVERGGSTITISFTETECSAHPSEFKLNIEQYDLWMMYGRFLTDADSPLKSLKIYDENAALLYERTFKIQEAITSYMIEIEDAVTAKFWAEVEYYGYEGAIKHGWPVTKTLPENPTEEDLKYARNEMLDEIVQRFGLFRRNYREDIQSYDFPTTYPVAYPFDVEQDYWLERRFLEAYTSLYETYGLLKAEIHSYLGVIPTIKPMIDYVLIWDERTWDDWLWAGDDYWPAVYEVRIPLDSIPSNFVLLGEEDLQRIVNRCKAFGTKVIPLYEVDGELYCDADLSQEIEREFELLGELLVGVEMDEGNCIWGFMDVESVLSVMMDLEKTAPTTVGATISAEVLKVTGELIEDHETEFAINYMNGVEVSGSGSSAKIQLQTIAGLQTLNGTFLLPSAQLGATREWDQIRTVQTLTGPDEILVDVFSEEVHLSQENHETEIALGTPEQRKIAQPINPTKNEITGVILKAGTIVGTPTDSVRVTLYYANSSDDPTGLPLISYEIPAASFSGDLEFLVDYEFDVSLKYVIVVDRTGTHSDTDYYNVQCANSVYPKGTKVFNGIYWFTVFNDLYFKTMTPKYFAEDQHLPVRITDMIENNVKARFKLSRSEAGASPYIEEIYVESLGEF